MTGSAPPLVGLGSPRLFALPLLTKPFQGVTDKNNKKLLFLLSRYQRRALPLSYNGSNKFHITTYRYHFKNQCIFL